MCLACAVHHFEIIAEFVMQTIFAVTDNIKPAAFLWSIGGEGGNNNMTSLLDGTSHSFDIFPAVLGIRQEMEHSPIMSDIVELTRQLRLCNIRLDPVDFLCQRTKSLSGGAEGRGGNIQDADVFIAVYQEVVHERRDSASDVNDLP
jgi:hypothetical protein